LRPGRLGERLEHGDLAVELGGVASQEKVAGFDLGARRDVHACGGPLFGVQGGHPGLEYRGAGQLGEIAQSCVAGTKPGDHDK
jgi:hypothetical protein